MSKQTKALKLAQNYISRLARNLQMDSASEAAKLLETIDEALAEESLGTEQPGQWIIPKTAEQISDFIGSDYVWREHKVSDVAPHEDDQYCVTAHDLISAFERLADHIGDANKMAKQPVVNQQLTTETSQEPYGWKVYGVNSLFMGEFAEADAKAEAKRIGGTCIAFPLYTAPRPTISAGPITPAMEQGPTPEQKAKIVEAMQPAQQDIPDLIAGALGVSRGTAYDLMREALMSVPDGAEQPAQRKPLTDEQINLFINGRGEEGDDDYVEPTGDGFGLTNADLVRLVRRVEAAHGIK